MGSTRSMAMGFSPPMIMWLLAEARPAYAVAASAAEARSLENTIVLCGYCSVSGRLRERTALKRVKEWVC